MAVLEVSERHQELIDELLADVAAYNPDVDRDLITRAFRFAAQAHEGQQRRSGEEFVLHPWGAAKICAQLRLDDETIERIGPLPQGKGLLGALINDPRPIRLRHMSDDTRSTGLSSPR